jgi:HlyD family secretion protein
VQLDLPVRVDTRNGIVPGRVIRIDPAVQNGTVQVDVELTADLPAGARPDLSVDGADGQAQRVDVALGRASINLIEIRSGLEPGDLVVLSDTSAWDQYDEIRLE